MAGGGVGKKGGQKAASIETASRPLRERGTRSFLRSLFPWKEKGNENLFVPSGAALRENKNCVVVAVHPKRVTTILPISISYLTEAFGNPIPTPSMLCPVPMYDNVQAPTRQLRNLKFVNNVIANVLSIMLNLFLIAVIQTQAKKQLRHYRKVLLLSTIVDLMLASLGLILQPTYFAPNGIFIIIIDGIIKPLPQPWTTVGAMLPLFVMYLLLTIVPVSFIYRYMLICKNTEPSSRVFVCLIGGAIGVSAGYTSVWTFHLWPSSSASQTQNNFSKYLDNEHWYLPDGRIPPFSAAVYADMSHVAYLSALIMISVYAIVIPCSLLIMRTLHRNRASMSAKTRQLQGQISRVLFAQAFVPFATIIVPFIVDILSIYCGLYFADSGLVLLIITAWAPVVNPVVTFCVVGQYRQAAVAFMQKITTFTTSNSTTSDGKTFSFSGAVLPTPKTGLLMHRESLSTRFLGGSTSLGGARRPSTLEITKTFIGP